MPEQIHFEGLKELIEATDPAILRKPLRDYWKRAAALVQGEARQYAPVDTGHLKNAIASEVDSSPTPRWARVGFLNASPGSPLWFKARAMEYGTGRVGDPEVSHKSSHWPPGAALDRWAGRHGFASGGAVAAIIGRRGGLVGRRFLRIGLHLHLGEIKSRLLRQLGEEIAREWARQAARRASSGLTTE